MYFLFFDNYTSARIKIQENGLYIHEVIVKAVNKRQAIQKFYSRFGIDPEKTTCKCCASQDYYISSFNTLQEAEEGILHKNYVVYVLKGVQYYKRKYNR